MKRRAKTGKQTRPKKNQHKPPHLAGIWTHCYGEKCGGKGKCSCDCGGCEVLRRDGK